MSALNPALNPHHYCRQLIFIRSRFGLLCRFTESRLHHRHFPGNFLNILMYLNISIPRLFWATFSEIRKIVRCNKHKSVNSHLNKTWCHTYSELTQAVPELCPQTLPYVVLVDFTLCFEHSVRHYWHTCSMFFVDVNLIQLFE